MMRGKGYLAVSIVRVTWAQVGRVTEPGRHMFRFGFVTITADDVAIWSQFPDASFALVPIVSDGPAEEYKLGSFVLSPQTNGVWQ